jgi:ion channel
MNIALTIIGLVILFAVLLEAFESIILPRRVTRRFRLTRLFYRMSWMPYRAFGRRLKSDKTRESFFSYFGPMSLLLLLVFWAASMVVGFAFLFVAAGPPTETYKVPIHFADALYISGTNFFTLGLEDAVPRTPSTRFITVTEAGVGLGFLAVVIGYLPVIFQNFSKREVSVVLLDARAGSPPTAAELLRRHTYHGGLQALESLFFEWERWSAELLESHLSYPVLCYFRSQHDNQSWLGALTAILDACALSIVGVEGACGKQAQLTFAVTRHAVVDLAQIFHATPRPPHPNRLPAAELARMRQVLSEASLKLRTGEREDKQLNDLRAMYEPYVTALADFLAIKLPPWIHSQKVVDSWSTSAWGRISGTAHEDEIGRRIDEHL